MDGLGSYQSRKHSTIKTFMTEKNKRKSKSPLIKYLKSKHCDSQNHACGVLHAYNHLSNDKEYDQRDERYFNKTVSTIPRDKSTLKISKILKVKSNTFQLYDLFSKQYEIDVMFTLERDCIRKKDQEKQEEIAQKNEIKYKLAQQKLKQQLKKCDEILYYYFEHKLIEELEDEEKKKKQKQKEELKKQKEELKKQKEDSKSISKSKAIKKEDEEDDEESDEKSNIKQKIMSDSKKEQAPQSQIEPSLQQTQIKEKTYLETLKEKADEKFLKKTLNQNENDHQNVKNVLHIVIEHQIQTNFQGVHQIYKEVNDQYDKKFKGSDEEFRLVFQDFFSHQNCILRLDLLRLKINKSKIKMETPLTTYYINTQLQDKFIYFCYLGTNDEAKLIIEKYVLEMEEKRKLIHKAIQQKEERKRKKYMDKVYQSVFGESYDPKHGLDFKHRKDYTQPKDKWKLGKELLELRKQFPHDRVLQRMIEEEFKKNQAFKYPEEYDIFNQNAEQNLKKNFVSLQEQQEQFEGKIAWKIPNFTKEKTIIEDFKRRDIYEKRQLMLQKKEELQKEEALEMYLQEQAYKYHDWMLSRHLATKKNKKTHRAVLVEVYNQMVQNHEEVAHLRFPHIAYGQDPNSETFKKSFPESFKRYFFRIVNSIVRLKNGKKVKTKNQSTLILMAGARQITQKDPIDIQSFNQKLQKFQIGQVVRQLRRNDPKCWRTRVFKREDCKNKLKNIFMQISEQENCTFEPEAGALNRNWKTVVNFSKEPRLKQDSIPGEYFERMGENFCKSNPQIYKQGKLKKAIAQLRNGDAEMCFNIILEGFDLTKLYQHYKPQQYKIWHDFLQLENDKAFAVNKQISPEKAAKQQKIESDDLNPEQLENVKSIFNQIDKKAQGFIKIKDLDEAMRNLGISPNAQDLQDMELKLEKEGIKNIEIEKFVSMMTEKLKDKDSKKDLIKAFQMLDRDNSGSIDKREFHYVITHLDTDLTEQEINVMLKAADTDGNGEISQGEFIKVMQSKKGKLKGSNYLVKMKQLIKRFIKREELKRQFKKMGDFIPKMLDKAKEKVENELKLHPEKKIIYIEDFQNGKYQALYEEAWDLLNSLLKRDEEAEKRKNNLNKQTEILKKAEEALKEQEELGGHGNADLEENDGEELKNMFKTIMCPLKNQCPKFKNLRWPSSSLKAITKFGKDCPYAHHPMELQFPQTLKMRIQGNKNSQKQEQALVQRDFKYAGQLFECKGCGAGCNLCKYKKLAQKFLEEMKDKTSKKDAVDNDQIIERKKNNDNQREMFAKKFGILKKASVLLFYGRANDAFDEIAKAAQIIKNQKEAQKEVELNLQKRWQFKLGLQDGFELPKPIDKIKPEDVTDEFLKSIDTGGSVDKSTLKLYINNVCPLIRSQFDRDTFLNGLIEDLYFKCEDIMIEKKTTIEKIQKNLEKLGEIQELMEALGSDADAEKDAEAFVDNEGNPLRYKKKKKKICEKVQQKKLYKEDGIEMKTVDKYYVDANYHKQITQDPKTETMKCVICPLGKTCPHAHNAIELDLTPINFLIKNLQGVVKTQLVQLKNDKPLEPWRPSAKSFSAADLPEYGKKPKKPVEGNEEQEDQVKKKGILARENVFRKPYEKE